MKGVVFTLMGELVEEKFGLDVWDALIDETRPASAGAYTTVATYPDAELFAYVGCLSARTGVPPSELTRNFGVFMLHRFAGMHPEFFSEHTARSFLMSVHDVIHAEVRKLHSDVLLPNFTYLEPGDGRLQMRYESQRRLCHLAEGLIDGTAGHFSTPIAIRHDVCMHLGADHCLLDLTFGD